MIIILFDNGYIYKFQGSYRYVMFFLEEIKRKEGLFVNILF